MKVGLVHIFNSGDNKDYNGGFGTTWNIGVSFWARIFAFLRAKLEYFPLLSYGYAAALLKKNGHTVFYSENAVPAGCDLVLLQVSPIRFSKEIDFLKKLRDTKVKIGIFGPFASVCPELFSGLYDFLIVGEPESALNALVDGEIPQGIIQSLPVQDLDILPFPDWSVFPYKKFRYGAMIPKHPFLFLSASRGCPLGCSYCPYKVFGLYRQRDPLRVADEVEYLVERYKAKGLMFRDPFFSLNRVKSECLSEELLRRNIHIHWGCETKIDSLDEQLLENLYASGLRLIKVGIESVNRNGLSRLGRATSGREHEKRMVDYCRKKGIRIAAFYILGLPEDTEETMQQTVKYAQILNTDFANFTLCTPLPGTAFYEQMKSTLITQRWEDFDNFHPVFQHPFVTAARLKQIQNAALLGYYLRLPYLFQFLKRSLFS